MVPGKIDGDDHAKRTKKLEAGTLGLAADRNSVYGSRNGCGHDDIMVYLQLLWVLLWSTVMGLVLQVRERERERRFIYFPLLVAIGQAGCGHR